MATRGRPTKFTPERTERLIEAIRAGNYRITACQYAGISKHTLRNWIAIAQGPDAPPEYLDFLAALEKAEAEAEAYDLALIRNAARGEKDPATGEYTVKPQWQAAAWRLERKNPERWGRRDATKVELTGADGGPVEMNVTLGVDDTAIMGLALSLAARQRELDDGETGELGAGDWVESRVVEPLEEEV